MNKQIKNLFFVLCISIISMFIIFFMIYSSKNCCFWDDDSIFTIYEPGEKYFDCLFGKTRLYHGGYYIGQFLSKFFIHGLPNILQIHPGDFITYPNGFLKGIFTVITLLLIAEFSIFKSKSKLIFLSFFFFLTTYFFYNAPLSKILTVNYNFYRYFFSFIFFSIFWFYIYKSILSFSVSKYTKTNNIKLFFVTLCGFILGTSIEISFYSSAFLVFLIMVYNAILNLFIKKNKNLIKQKYNLDKNFYIPVSGLLSGIIIFVTNPGSVAIAGLRGLNNIYVTMNIFNEFLHLYIQRFFLEHIIYWIILVILISFSLYFAYKREEIKNVIFPLFMQISVLSVLFSLIICRSGETGYYGDYWIDSHVNILFLYKILIIYPILIYFDYLFNLVFFEKDSKTQLKILSPITSITYCIIVIVIIGMFNIYKTYELFQSDYYKSLWFNIGSIQKRKELYIIEKIFRFYALRNEKPIIPNHYMSINGFYPCLYPYLRDPEWNVWFDHLKNVKTPYVNDYMNRVYKDNRDYEYEINDNAMYIFYTKGGTFTDEEMKNIKFSRLFDKKFVLNEK